MRATMLLAVLIAVPTPAPAADRPNDKDVKAIIEQVNHDRDRFEDQLDDQFKNSTLRSETGETNVSKFLDDLQENVNHLKDRFTDDYSASAEATTVLRQGTSIQNYMSKQPPNFKGASDWNKLASTLGQLAAAYGTTFPLSEGMTARRMNDKEVKSTAEGIAQSADRLKKELGYALKADKAAKESAEKDVDGLKEAAKALGSRVGGDRPASGEAKTLLDHAAVVQTKAAGKTLSAAGQTALESVNSGVAKIAEAFGMK